MKLLLERLMGRFQVTTRIAIAIVFALICLQTLVVLQFVLTPEPRWTMYGLRWLANTSKGAAQTAFGAPIEQRAELLNRLEGSGELVVGWQPQRPFFSRDRSPFAARIEATVQDAVGTLAKEVRVDVAAGRPGGPPNSLRFVPAELENALHKGALRAEESDLPIPGHFHIHIRGTDDTWITLKPRDERDGILSWALRSLPLVGGTLVVILVSLFTARRILAPLDKLKSAAVRLGVERVPAPIEPRGLGEFASIASAFNDMQARLKRFVDERTHVLAAISHDLRTSLTRLRLDIEELKEGKVKTALAREVDEMEAMISATLSFATGDAKEEKSRTIDLAALLISLCDNVADRGGQIRYEGPDHARLRCQPLMMKRALSNIIDNAVKYAGQVRVGLDQRDTAFAICISDQGPGIPADRHAEAFAPFRRLENSRSRDTGGVGLGLTIARDVVHAHGGTIALGNSTPQGLIVTIVVPAQ
jgi:signal transduction histidine kinase